MPIPCSGPRHSLRFCFLSPPEEKGIEAAGFLPGCADFIQQGPPVPVQQAQAFLPSPAGPAFRKFFPGEAVTSRILQIAGDGRLRFHHAVSFCLFQRTGPGHEC